MYVSSFWTANYERKSCLNWMVSLQVLPHSQLILPSRTWFLGIYLKFPQQKSLKNQYLPHCESKSCQINSIKSCSSRSFQQHQRHIPIPLKISRTFAPQVQTAWEPSPCTPRCWEFSKDTITRSKASRLSGSHNYKTKQKKTNLQALHR